jgi:hypothetical protein
MGGGMISCEEHFPEWITARIILTEWIVGIDGWDVSFNIIEHKANIVPHNRGNLTPATFPEEDFDKVMELCNPVLATYLPEAELMRFLSSGPIKQAANAAALMVIQSIVQNHERVIIANGGDSFRDALAKALGIYPLNPTPRGTV